MSLYTALCLVFLDYKRLLADNATITQTHTYTRTPALTLILRNTATHTDRLKKIRTQPGLNDRAVLKVNQNPEVQNMSFYSGPHSAKTDDIRL